MEGLRSLAYSLARVFSGSGIDFKVERARE